MPQSVVLVRIENMTNLATPPRKRRVLCIDGGGVRGAFPAAFLAELERHCSRPISSYFDLIAGTSTGGIIAIALALGHSGAEISDFYQRRGPEVFGQQRSLVGDAAFRVWRGVRWLYGAKHSSAALGAALRDLLGDARLGDAKTRLLIPAWNPEARSVYVYKTAHHERLTTDYKERAVDVALATGAAPSYFPQHVTPNGLGLLDGGVWANNPTAIGTVEAIGVLGWPGRTLHVLSLGCLEETYTIPRTAGLGRFGRKGIKLFLDGQSHGAMGMAKLLTGHEHSRDAIHRINLTAPLHRYKMDDPRGIPELTGLGHSVGRDRWPILKPIFFDCAADDFTPLHSTQEVNNGN